MCNPASFIVTKGFKVFWTKEGGAEAHSHLSIIRAHGLPNVQSAGRITSVAVEITPPVLPSNCWDAAAPYKKWKFKVDQDLRPDWWDPAAAEQACREALKEWGDAMIIRSDAHTVAAGQYVWAAIGGDTLIARGGHVEILAGTATASVYGHLAIASGGTINSVDGIGTIGTLCGSTVEQVLHGGTISLVRSGVIRMCNGVVAVLDGGRINVLEGGGIVRSARGFSTIGIVGNRGSVLRVEPSLGCTPGDIRTPKVYEGIQLVKSGGLVRFNMPFKTKVLGAGAMVVDQTRDIPRVIEGRDRKAIIAKSS